MGFSLFFLGQDWKELRRFESLKNNDRTIVFYAENKASLNHFKLLISELTEKMNLNRACPLSKFLFLMSKRILCVLHHLLCRKF